MKGGPASMIDPYEVPILAIGGDATVSHPRLGADPTRDEVRELVESEHLTGRKVRVELGAGAGMSREAAEGALLDAGVSEVEFVRPSTTEG